MGTHKRGRKSHASTKAYDTVKQQEYRDSLRADLNGFYEKYAPRVKKMLRCLCSAKCRMKFMTDIGHRIHSDHKHRVEGPMVHSATFGGGKGKAW